MQAGRGVAGAPHDSAQSNTALTPIVSTHSRDQFGREGSNVHHVREHRVVAPCQRETCVLMCVRGGGWGGVHVCEGVVGYL